MLNRRILILIWSISQQIQCWWLQGKCICFTSFHQFEWSLLPCCSWNVQWKKVSCVIYLKETTSMRIFITPIRQLNVLHSRYKMLKPRWFPNFPRIYFWKEYIVWLINIFVEQRELVKYLNRTRVCIFVGVIKLIQSNDVCGTIRMT